MKNRTRAVWTVCWVALLHFAVVYTAGADGEKSLVLVAGATGRTGQEVVKQLLAKRYRVRALVREKVKGEELFGSSVDYAVGDVREAKNLPPAMKGASFVISVIGATRGDPSNSFEQVDYGGNKNLADAARAAGVKQFLLVSSMGVTHPEGMRVEPPGSPTGVLLWKLKGEDYLRSSGMTYTVIRPGGLGDKPGGQQGILVQQGDKPIAGDFRARVIPRADVASVLVNAIGNPDAFSKTFEIMGDPTNTSVDWANFFKPLARDKH